MTASSSKNRAIQYCSLLFLLHHRCRALSRPSPSNTRRDFLESAAASSVAASSAASFPDPSAAAEGPSAAGPSAAGPSAAGPSAAGPSSAASLRQRQRPSIPLPPLGLGTWAWGDPLFWGYDRKDDDELREVFDYALAKDLAFFDTAELYGLGRSEELLGKFRRESLAKRRGWEVTGGGVTIATKFAPLPWRTRREDVVAACRASVDRLGVDSIDLYQIHFPNAWSNAEYWDGLADAVDAGLVKSVGVSNYGADALRACHARLAERGIRLATNQVQLSLLYRWPIDNGLLDACRELDVKVLSYSPLALGFLAGKYDAESLPRGPRGKIGKRLFEDGDGAYGRLLAVMAGVAANHGDAPLSQVAINWAIAKGTIPIPGARNVRQAKQNISALCWSLTAKEMESLDAASMEVTGFVTPDKNPFPRKDVNTGLVMYDS